MLHTLDSEKRILNVVTLQPLETPCVFSEGSLEKLKSSEQQPVTKGAERTLVPGSPASFSAPWTSFSLES